MLNDDLKDYEKAIAFMIRALMVISVILVITGGIVYIVHTGSRQNPYHAFIGEPSSLRSIYAVIKNALKGDFKAIIQLGILLLLVNPLARVAGYLKAFFHLRDWLYIIITIIVLGVLLYSFCFAFRESGFRDSSPQISIHVNPL